MSPQNARVFIAEDDKSWQEIYRYHFKDSEHIIVELAKNMEEVENILPRLAELEIQVAIVDGNLSPHGHDGFEGKFVIREIKRLFPHIKTIGMSGMFALGADIDLGKENANSLMETITNL